MDAVEIDALNQLVLDPFALTPDANAISFVDASHLDTSHLDTSSLDTDMFDIDNFDIMAVDVDALNLDDLDTSTLNTPPFESYAHQIDYVDSYAAVAYALDKHSLDTGAFDISAPFTIDTPTLDLTGNTNLDHLNNVNDNATLDFSEQSAATTYAHSDPELASEHHNKGLYYTLPYVSSPVPDEEPDLPLTQPAPQQAIISQSSTSSKRRSVATRQRTTAVVNSLAPSGQKSLPLATDPPSLQQPSLASSKKKSKPGPDVGPWNILTDEMASAMNNQRYDPYWLARCGRDIESFGLSSAMKLDLLFRNDVLRVNDVFVISVNDRSSETVVEKGMEVRAFESHE